MIFDKENPGSALGPILVVDDREENLDVLELILKDLQRPILRASSGADALRRLLEQDVAVILLDVRMPDMDGYETAALIRGRLRTRHTPIIFLTAFDTTREHLARAYSVGAVDFIFKPIVPEILRSKVSVFVDLMEKTQLVERQLEALRRGEEKFRALAETASDAIVSVDAWGRIFYFNRAAERTFGYLAEEAAGKTLSLILADRGPETRGLEPRSRGTEAASFSGGATELEGRRKDGQEFPMEASWGTYKAGDETIFTVILRDVSERKRAEQDRDRMNARLLQGQKLQALGQLAAGVAHEINNPTSYLLSNLGTLQEYFRDLGRFVKAAEEALDGLEPRPEVAEARAKLQSLGGELRVGELVEDGLSALQDCRHGAERIRDIVRTLREYSHPDDRDFAPADLGGIVEGAVRLCWSEIKHRIRLTQDLDPLPPVRCHAQQVEQVFVNLLVNASQAIRDKGEIELTARQEGDQAVVRIRDSGCGIPPEHIAKLFEPFFTTKPVGQGTGLGLYLVHRIVVGHGGRVDVSSSPERGTEFTVRLPVAGPGGKTHADPSDARRDAASEVRAEAPRDPGGR
jgi:two-component system, NtrC family, sensor kinase